MKKERELTKEKEQVEEREQTEDKEQADKKRIEEKEQTKNNGQKEESKQDRNKKQTEEKRTYKFRPLNELNLIDNFLLGSALGDHETGEEFAAKILKIITGRDFEKLKVVMQKQIYGIDTNLHGTRLDVYIEDAPEGELATIYDVESEKKDTSDDKKAIPQRTRFYHAKLSSMCLASGESYQNLKNVLVIMITPFDPFDKGRMMYTIKNRCIEDPDMPYDDGATTIFLYTKGKIGIPSQEIKEFLEYFENTKDENAVNPDLKRIGEMVRRVKQNAKVGVRYMQLMEDESYLINIGVEHGKEIERENTRKAEERANTAEKKNIEKDALIAEKDAEIADKDAEIAEKDAEIAELKAKLAAKG